MSELPDRMNCTVCHSVIDVTDPWKYIVIFESRGGFRLEVGCAHYKPSPIADEKMLAAFSGTNCTMLWMEHWLKSLRCEHNDRRADLN
jgi:hypothetical protein